MGCTRTRTLEGQSATMITSEMPPKNQGCPCRNMFCIKKQQQQQQQQQQQSIAAAFLAHFGSGFGVRVKVKARVRVRGWVGLGSIPVRWKRLPSSQNAKSLPPPKISGLLIGRDPTRGPCQEVIKVSRVEWGRVRRCLKYHGTGRVGSGRVRRFRISRVGTGCPNSTSPAKIPEKDPRNQMVRPAPSPTVFEAQI